MKILRNDLLVTLCLTASVLFASPVAMAGTDITSNVAPPPARNERAPAPHDGYVWAAGYWDWNGHRYTWISGSFMPERRGRHWVAARWEQVETHWQLIRGHWENQ
jgi:WXXGXW repeat (2 copies)